MAGGKPIPRSQFALPNANGGKGGYPVDTVKRARNALSRIAQYGTPEQKARVKRAVQRRYSAQINVGGVQNHANRYDFADGMTTCPSCGHSFYANDDADNGRGAGGASGSSVPNTPQTAPTGSRPSFTVRGASSGNMGLANQQRRSINLARRMPVQRDTDVVVNRNPDGSATIRHRSGGTEVGQMLRTADGWTPVVGGKSLTPHRQQRGALLELFGTYNKDVAVNPYVQPPVQQTPLMAQYGVPAIRLAMSDDDADDNDSASSDTDSSDSNGLNPRGQSIYKKLCAKGVKPAVAMAMAKRAQNTKPGSFGNAKAS
jgi:hypothetical protein